MFLKILISRLYSQIILPFLTKSSCKFWMQQFFSPRLNFSAEILLNVLDNKITFRVRRKFLILPIEILYGFEKYYGGGGGNRTRIQRLRSGESTRLVEFTFFSLLTSSKPTRTRQKLVWLKSHSRPQTVGANQLELSYASFGRFKLTSGETLVARIN